MDIVEVKVEHDEESDNFSDIREYAIKHDPDFDAAALLHPNTKKKGGRPRKGLGIFCALRALVAGKLELGSVQAYMHRALAVCHSIPFHPPPTQPL